LQELLLSPGERAEVLVKGDREPKQYRLLNLPYSRGGMGMMGNMGGMGMMHNMNSMGDMENASASQTPQPLATLVYKDAASSIPLPKRLIPVETLPEPTNIRRIELSMAMEMAGMESGMNMNGGIGMKFMFNGKTFDMNRVDAAVKLGTVEEWELVNSDPDQMDHPFHLHVNPFQIINRNGQPEPYRAWKDTVIVKGSETVRIRIPFQDFLGKTVYHCHILDHEDLGMMGVVEMV
jgi:FtsP/CotA-like multicopper oxidase with cupredoxin domain